MSIGRRGGRRPPTLRTRPVLMGGNEPPLPRSRGAIGIYPTNASTPRRVYRLVRLICALGPPTLKNCNRRRPDLAARSTRALPHGEAPIAYGPRSTDGRRISGRSQRTGRARARLDALNRPHRSSRSHGPPNSSTIDISAWNARTASRKPDKSKPLQAWIF